jgi:hypothetical protein
MQVKTLRASRQDVLGGRHGSTLDVQFFERFEEVGQLATFGIIACDLCENAGGGVAAVVRFTESFRCRTLRPSLYDLADGREPFVQSRRLGSGRVHVRLGHG